MDGLSAIVIREFLALIGRPRVHALLAGFVVIAGLCAVYPGRFFSAGRADLDGLFRYLPWLLAVLAPMLANRSWSEEVRTGRIHFLLSLPIGVHVLALGKFLALWLMGLIALIVTMGFWVAAAELGDPDHGAILAGYFGAFLALGALLAVSGAFAVFSVRPILPFAGALCACLALTAIGEPGVNGWIGSFIGQRPAEILAFLGYWDYFNSAQLGVIEGRFLLWALATIIAALSLAGIFVAGRRAG